MAQVSWLVKPPFNPFFLVHGSTFAADGSLAPVVVWLLPFLRGDRLSLPNFAADGSLALLLCGSCLSFAGSAFIAKLCFSI
jgi:hypothetical protein